MAGEIAAGIANAAAISFGYAGALVIGASYQFIQSASTRVSPELLMWAFPVVSARDHFESFWAYNSESYPLSKTLPLQANKASSKTTCVGLPASISPLQVISSVSVSFQPPAAHASRSRQYPNTNAFLDFGDAVTLRDRSPSLRVVADRRCAGAADSVKQMVPAAY